MGQKIQKSLSQKVIFYKKAKYSRLESIQKKDPSNVFLFFSLTLQIFLTWTFKKITTSISFISRV